MEKWAELYSGQRDKRRLESDLIKSSSALQNKNDELSQATANLQRSLTEQSLLVKELQCWVHPFVLKGMRENVNFPMKRDLTLLVTDIVDSGKIHSVSVNGAPLREKILQTFWDIVIKHGGEVESQEGDKAYANFGLTESEFDHSRAAFAAAKEFRAALDAINDHYDCDVACGMALHYAKDCRVCLRQTVVYTPDGIVNRKKFDTASSDVDLVHRMEQVTHSMPGSNIMISDSLLEKLDPKFRRGVKALGSQLFKGQPVPISVSIALSDRVEAGQFEEFLKKLDRQSAALKGLEHVPLRTSAA